MRIAYGRADGEESGNRATFGESRRIRRHARGGKSGPSRSRLVAERHGAPGSRRVYCVAAYVAQRQERRIHGGHLDRSEEHTSELQSLMRISYAVFCLKTKKERT